jgi:hypothetical protein
VWTSAAFHPFDRKKSKGWGTDDSEQILRFRCGFIRWFIAR